MKNYKITAQAINGGIAAEYTTNDTREAHAIFNEYIQAYATNCFYDYVITLAHREKIECKRILLSA